MCNVAGYVGKKQAAPIMLELIKKQEGYAGGYYAGISTVENGKIFFKKLTGSVSDLESMADIPGTTGLIHSRSNAGGDDSWAHPFISLKDGEAYTAYVAVGSNGYFKPLMPRFNEITVELFNQGITMLSATDKVESEIYPGTPDGKKVHMSDVMCQLIYRNLLSGMRSDVAMAEAFKTMPGEIIGLNVCVDEPDRIAYGKISEALFVGFAPHGAYISSTPTAFPEDTERVVMLPEKTSGWIKADRVEIMPFELDARVKAVDFSEIEKFKKIMIKLLREEQDFYSLWRNILPHLEGADVYQVSTLLYQTLEAIDKDGRLSVRETNVNGANDEHKALCLMFGLKN